MGRRARLALRRETEGLGGVWTGLEQRLNCWNFRWFSAIFRQFTRRGHVKAADNYGLMLFQEGKHEKAMPLIRAAAERGDPRAQYVLGLSHFNADYAPQDWVRAYALMTLAQGQGLPQAQSALAQMDLFVPLLQRQQAQSLARQLEADAKAQPAADFNAAELGADKPTQAAVPEVAVASAHAQTPAQTHVQAHVQARCGSCSSGTHWRQVAGAARRVRGCGQCRSAVEQALWQSGAGRHQEDTGGKR